MFCVLCSLFFPAYNTGMQSLNQPTPITLLTGFLGAGKTTVLNRILRGASGLRVAVLVNDFGAINIDAELVESVREDTVNLRNGCICCSIRGDLLAAVLELLRRTEPPDYIIVECSGVAEPVAVARTFTLPEVRPYVRLDSTITVVDADQVHAHDECQDLIADQIAAADIVLLNKIDLASPRLRAGLQEWIRYLVPEARILEAEHGRVPLELLLGVGAPARALDLPEEPHQHTTDFATWSFISDRPFDFHRLRQVLTEVPTAIFRGKGIVWIRQEQSRQVVFQLVGRRTSLSPAREWGEQPRRSRLVLIGHPGTVDSAILHELFSRALVENDDC